MIYKKLHAPAAGMLLFVALMFLGSLNSYAGKLPAVPGRRIDSLINKIMKDNYVPGLSIAIVNGDQQQIKTYGYSSLERKTPVTPGTLFQIGSCSKAFTALAMIKLVSEQHINLDEPVSKYLPWFKVTYKNAVVPVTLRQLLNHTSGIPWKTISTIPQRNDAAALEQTVRNVSTIQLHNLPGTQYEYATINYDIIALVIQTITGKTFESYIQHEILDSLQLAHTTIGVPVNDGTIAQGYKVSFLNARAYNSPVFKGNNAAGYVISNANDMVKWLRFQMGLTTSPLYKYAYITHQRDETVAPSGLMSYAMGWEVSLSGNGQIMHDGVNPNFTSYVAFIPGKHLGLVILTNSSSNAAQYLGAKIMAMLSGEDLKKLPEPDNSGDKIFTIVSAALAVYTFVVIGLILFFQLGRIGKKRKLQLPDSKSVFQFFIAVLLITPVVYSIYLLPNVFGFSWGAIRVWSPDSFVVMIKLIIASIVTSYLSYFISLFLPSGYNFKSKIPLISLMSILSGLSNMGMILLITSSLRESIEVKYLAFYYGVMLLVYLLGRRYVQVSLINTTRKVVYDVRVKLIKKIFSTSYHKFEKIDKGRIYSTLNDDVSTIGNAVNMIVALISSTVTVAGIFLYLATLELWATILTIALIVVISIVYTAISRATHVYFEKARDSQNTFMRLLSGIIDGYKELSLHQSKRVAYGDDVANTAHEFSEKSSIAQTKLLYASLLGELSLMVLMGLSAFGIPELFPDIELYKVANFVILLLYLNGPLNVILNSVPGVMLLRVAWNRIQLFISDIPADLNTGKLVSAIDKQSVLNIKATGVTYQYKNNKGGETFSIGPIDLEAERGEIIFIIGGNGSGKTTLAKLLTGLYPSTSGKISINGKAVECAALSEYFSAVFNPCHLFEKLYGIDTEQPDEVIADYLTMLGLTDKVKLKDNEYSTLDLSAGQRKRLALLQCFLEDSPIYLFDEWSADQDPEYRRFFYKVILPEMREQGKIIIAITHDDHYFDVADKILKMDSGKAEYVSNHYKIDSMLASSLL